MIAGTHGILVTTPGEKRARWLTTKGSLTTKRIHAGVQTKDKAEEFAEQLRNDNPGYLFRVATPMGRG